MQLGGAAVASATGQLAGPAAFLFLRFALATTLMPVLVPSCLRGLDRGAWKAGLLLAIPFFTGFLLQVEGLKRTTPTLSAFLTSLTVLTTPVLGLVWFKERVGGRLAIAALLALAGVWVMTDPGGGSFRLGEALTALSAVAWAFQIHLTGRVTRDRSPEAVTLAQFVFMTLFSAGALLVLGADWVQVLGAWRRPNAAWTLVFTAVVCSVAAITIMNRFQKEIPASRAAVIYSLEPVLAAVFAAIFVGEPMTGRKVAGGLVLVAANLVCEMRQPLKG
jgi:drug/metabolite transporter (DMT)-like permease